MSAPNHTYFAIYDTMRVIRVIQSLNGLPGLSLPLAMLGHRVSVLFFPKNTDQIRLTAEAILRDVLPFLRSLTSLPTHQVGQDDGDKSTTALFDSSPCSLVRPALTPSHFRRAVPGDISARSFILHSIS